MFRVWLAELGSSTALGLLVHSVADDEGEHLEIDHQQQEGRVNHVLVTQHSTWDREKYLRTLPRSFT